MSIEGMSHATYLSIISELDQKAFTNLKLQNILQAWLRLGSKQQSKWWKSIKFKNTKGKQ
jgi:hypothetical protein